MPAMLRDSLTDARAPSRAWTARRFRHRLPSRRSPPPRRRSAPTVRLPVAGHGYDPDLLVGRVVTYLSDHLADPNLDLNRLADAAHVSPSSLGRAFRDVLDTTPWRYVMRRRIDHAKRLLANTDRSLADIALDAGFYDQAHFSRTFKRFTDTTPGAFREDTHEQTTALDESTELEESAVLEES